MIDVIAAAPLQAANRELLERQVARFNGAALQILDTTSTAAINKAILASKATFILLVDQYSLPVGDWHRVGVPQRTGIISGVCATYAGTRAGYAFVRTVGGAKSLQRNPVALPFVGNSQLYIDLPNEGCMLVRRALFDQLGMLDETLSHELSFTDFALRVREAGLEVAYDASVSIERDSGHIEPTLADEAAFTALRSPSAWRGLVYGPARRAELHSVHILAHGMRDERKLRELVQIAGYPVAESRYYDSSEALAVLSEQLQQRDIYLVCLDLRVQAKQDWLLGLIEASTGMPSIGIVTAARDGGQRVVSADASATLVITQRIPPQILIDAGHDTLDAALSQLTTQAAELGVIAITAAAELTRANTWRPQILDEHTLAARLEKAVQSKKTTVILLAGSESSVHRYTTDALRSYSGELAELFVVVRSDAPKITARLRNHPNVELFVDADDELAGNAFSRALARASGDYIAVMRDDFLVAEHWLTSLHAHLDRLPMAGIVAPRLSAVPGEQNCEDELFADSVEFRLAAERRRKARAREAKLIDVIHMPAFLMRRAVLEKVGGFDEDLATSNYGVVDYCIRARTAGFQIALAEDVFLHHIPHEHTQLPFELLMGEATYERTFLKKWRLDGAAALQKLSFGSLIGSPIAKRRRFVLLAEEQAVVQRPTPAADEERVVLLLPVTHEDTWQQAGNVVRKYLTTFTSDDRVTLAIGRQDDVRTSVIARRIRKMIADGALQETAIPDIVISDAKMRAEWLASLPAGPRYLLFADRELPTVSVWDDLSPSGLRRAVHEFRNSSIV